MNLTQTTALKWTFYALAAAALFLLFFSNDFGLINIQQTTITR